MGDTFELLSSYALPVIVLYAIIVFTLGLTVLIINYIEDFENLRVDIHTKFISKITDSPINGKEDYAIITFLGNFIYLLVVYALTLLIILIISVLFNVNILYTITLATLIILPISLRHIRRYLKKRANFKPKYHK